MISLSSCDSSSITFSYVGRNITGATDTRNAKGGCLSLAFRSTNTTDGCDLGALVNVTSRTDASPCHLTRGGTFAPHVGHCAALVRLSKADIMCLGWWADP